MRKQRHRGSVAWPMPRPASPSQHRLPRLRISADLRSRRPPASGSMRSAPVHVLSALLLRLFSHCSVQEVPSFTARRTFPEPTHPGPVQVMSNIHQELGQGWERVEWCPPGVSTFLRRPWHPDVLPQRGAHRWPSPGAASLSWSGPKGDVFC